MTRVRKGQFPGMLSRTQFHERYLRSFFDPAFDAERDAIARLEAIAWDAYCDSRKSPVTKAAGEGFQDPQYQLSTEWLATRERLVAAEAKQKDPATRSRVLLVVGASRNDGTCPGEMSKTYRLTQLAREVVEAAAMDATPPFRTKCATSPGP